ncbi:FCD domain-containing protein [Rhizobium beringeri]
MIDAIELRGVLEGTAARLAAERGAPSAGLRQLAGVVAALDAVVAPGPKTWILAAMRN